GRISEVEVTIRLEDKIVGAVDPLAIEAIDQNGEPAIGLAADDVPVPMLAEDQPSLLIERKSVRTRLWTGKGARPGISAWMQEDGFALAFLPAVDRVLHDVRKE